MMGNLSTAEENLSQHNTEHKLCEQIYIYLIMCTACLLYYNV